MIRTRQFPILALCALAASTLAQADDAPQNPPPQATLQHVVVSATRPGESDYRVPAVDSLGPLGATPILDTPYSVSVLPLAVIQNSQAVNFKDVSKYLPLVAYQEQQGPDILRPQTRGMQGGNFQNTRVDGMTMFITVAQALEQFQQIEVVNGVSSFLYGAANPSGMFNFVTKRPTESALYELSASYDSDSIATAKVDLGGPLDDGGFVRYRLNALFGKGDGFVEHSHQRRALGDLGVDLHPSGRTVLELNYSDYSLIDQGYPGWFTYSETIHLPPAPDPGRVGYGQAYAGIDLITRMASARIKHELAANWHLVLGILNQDASRNINTPVNNLTSNGGAYTSSFANGFAPRFAITSDAGYLNGNFTTGDLAHDLTIGTAGYKARSFAVTTAASAASVRLGTASIADPAIFPEPAAGPPNVIANYDSSNTYQQGLNVGDAIRFNSYWSTRLGVSEDWFHVDNFNSKGVQQAGYASHGLSPAGSVLFKPSTNMTAYVTYASSLQAGDLAPGTAANAGVSLAPYRSTEYELGYKASLARIDLTAALFRIERPFANIDPTDNVFKISGQQVNRGLEVSAVGELASGLTVIGGVTLLDARLEHTPLLATNDQRYVGAPKAKGNVLLEYQVPGLKALVATFDYQFSGTRPANDTNSLTAAGYNLFDIGARYSTRLLNRPLTVRLAIDNLTDRNYWSTVAPSNLTGANTGSLIGHLGAPRTVLASVTLEM